MIARPHDGRYPWNFLGFVMCIGSYPGPMLTRRAGMARQRHGRCRHR
jgi:hypothetical protein